MNELRILLAPLTGTWAASLWRASWQGGLAFLLVYGICAALPALSPRARSWLWRLAYVKLLVALVCLAPVEVPLLPAAQALIPGRASAPPSVKRSVPPAARSTATAARAPEPAGLAAAGAERGTREDTLILLWLAGAAFAAFRLAFDRRRARRLLRTCEPTEDPDIRDVRTELCHAMRIRRLPSVVACDGGGSPLIAGSLRPVVVLPRQLVVESSALEVRLMLAHELAHLKRRDLLWSWLPALAQVLFFFHPLAWLAARELRLAHEMASDELALATTREPSGTYGRLLVRVAALPAGGARRFPVAAMAESYTTLKRRLLMIKRAGFVSHPLLKILAAGVIGVTVLALAPWRIVPRHAWHLERTLDLRPQLVHAIAFSPDARLMAAACGPWKSGTGEVVLWEMATGRRVRVLPQRTGAALTTTFVDGHLLAVGGEDGARLWDACTGGLVGEFHPGLDVDTGTGVHALAFSPTGRALAIARGTSLTLWYQAANDPSYFWTTPALRPLKWSDPSPAVGFISFSPDGETLAAGGRSVLVAGPHGAEPRAFVRLYEKSGRLIRTLDDQSDSVRPVVFSPDGTFLASGDWGNGTLRLRDGRTGRLLRILKVHNGLIGWAAFSPDSRLLATGCGDRGQTGEVELWDPRTGEHLETVGRHDGLVGALAFSPDGTRLASAGMDGVIRIWRGPAPAARH